MGSLKSGGGDRMKYNDNELFFKADGKSRGKLGVVPGYAKNVAWSYDPQHNVPAIILFDLKSSAKYLIRNRNLF